MPGTNEFVQTKQGRLDYTEAVKRGAEILAKRHRMSTPLFGTDEEVARGLVARELGANQVKELGYVRGYHSKVATYAGGKFRGDAEEITRMRDHMDWLKQQFGDSGWKIERVEGFSTNFGRFEKGRLRGTPFKLRNYRVTIRHSSSESLRIEIPDIVSLLPENVKGNVRNATDLGYYMYNGTVWATTGEIQDVAATKLKSGEVFIDATSARTLTFREKVGQIIKDATSKSRGISQNQFERSMKNAMLSGTPMPIGGEIGVDALQQLQYLMETTQLSISPAFKEDVEKMGHKGGVKLMSMLMESLRKSIGTGSDTPEVYLHPNPNRDTGRMSFVNWQRLVPAWGSKNYMKARTGNIQISGARQPRLRVGGDTTVPTTFNARVARVPLAAADEAHWLTENALKKIGTLNVQLTSIPIHMSFGREEVGSIATMGGDLADKIRYLVERGYINSPEELFTLPEEKRREIFRRANLEIKANDVIGIDYEGKAIRWRHGTVDKLSGITDDQLETLKDETREALLDRRMRGKIMDIIPDESGRSFRVVVNGELSPGEVNVKLVKADSTVRQIARWGEVEHARDSMKTATRHSKRGIKDWKHVNLEKADVIMRDMYANADIAKVLEEEEGIFIRNGKIVGLGVYTENGKRIVAGDVAMRGERTRERLGQMLVSIDDMIARAKKVKGVIALDKRFVETLKSAGIHLATDKNGMFVFNMETGSGADEIADIALAHKQWEATIQATLEFYSDNKIGTDASQATSPLHRLLPTEFYASYGITDYSKPSPFGAMIEPSVLAEFGRTEHGMQALLGIMELGVDPGRPGALAGEDIVTELRKFIASLSGQTVENARDIAETGRPQRVESGGRRAWRNVDAWEPGWYDIRTLEQRKGTKGTKGWTAAGHEIEQFYMPDLEKLGMMVKHAQDSYIINSDLGNKIMSFMNEARKMAKNGGMIYEEQRKKMEEVITAASEAILRNGQFYDNIMKFRASKSSVYKVVEGQMYMNARDAARVLAIEDAAKRSRAIKAINVQGYLLPGQVGWSAEYAEEQLKTLRGVVDDSRLNAALKKIAELRKMSAGERGIAVMSLSDILPEIGLIAMRQPMHHGWEKNIFAIDPVIVAGDPNGAAGALMGTLISKGKKILGKAVYAQSTGALSMMDFDADTLAHMFVGMTGLEAVKNLRESRRKYWASAMDRIAEAQDHYAELFEKAGGDMSKMPSWNEVIRSKMVGELGGGVQREGVMGMMDFKAMERMLEIFNPVVPSRDKKTRRIIHGGNVERLSTEDAKDLAILRTENERIRKQITDTSARRKYFGLLNSQLRRIEEAAYIGGDEALGKQIKSVTGALQQMDIWFKRISTADVEGTLGSRFLEAFQALHKRSRPDDIQKVAHDIWFQAAGGAEAKGKKVQQFIDQLGAMAGDEFRYAPPIGIETMEDLIHGSGNEWYTAALEEAKKNIQVMIAHAEIVKNDPNIIDYLRSTKYVTGRQRVLESNFFEITDAIFNAEGPGGQLVRMYQLAAGFEGEATFARDAARGTLKRGMSALGRFMGEHAVTFAKYGTMGFVGLAAVGAVANAIRSPKDARVSGTPKVLHGYDQPGGYDVRGTVDIGTADRLTRIMKSGKVKMGDNSISISDSRSSVDPLSIMEKRRRAEMYGF